MQRQLGPERPPARPARPPADAPRRGWPTIAWLCLTATLLTIGIAMGLLSFLALRGDDDKAAPKRAEQGITAAYGEWLEVPGVADVRVLAVDRMKRLPPRHE